MSSVRRGTSRSWRTTSIVSASTAVGRPFPGHDRSSLVSASPPMDPTSRLTRADHFATLDDPRVERTKLHPLLNLATIAICAVLTGAESWDDIELFGGIRAEWIASVLVLPHGIPSHDTFTSVFAALDRSAVPHPLPAVDAGRGRRASRSGHFPPMARLSGTCTIVPMGGTPSTWSCLRQRHPSGAGADHTSTRSPMRSPRCRRSCDAARFGFPGYSSPFRP